MRLLARIVYLAASLWWALFMVMSQAMHCDDACVARPSYWREDDDAWQWGYIGWLGAAGLGLAILAVSLSFARRRLAVAAVIAHAGVFTANCLIFYLGARIYGSFIPFAVGATVVFVAALTAVGLLPRRSLS